jgi:hypothetical protein
MALFCARRGRVSGRYNMALAFGLMSALAPSGVVAADIEVTIDQAKLVKLPERVATLVIGNPLIADVSVQSGGLVVITGKGYGATNIIALDRSGAVLMERVVEVLGRDDVVVVYKGVDRETYSCAPVCQGRITLGDAPAFYANTLVQTRDRNSAALGGGSAQPGAQGGPGAQGAAPGTPAR